MFSRYLAAAFVFSASLIAGAQQFGPWSAPVHIGAPVSSALYADLSPAISKDGLSLYFTCIRGNAANPACPEGDGIYVAQRKTLDRPWENPRFVMAGTDPNLSIDGHRLYFAFNGDLYLSRRRDKRDDFSWGPPEYLNGINSAFSEGSATVFEDEATGVTYLYFSSNRTDLGGPGDMDIYVSTLQADQTWSTPVVVSELSSSVFDNHPIIRRDGLEIFFVSNRCGSLLNAQNKPSNDIWTSTRASTSEPWSTPLNIDADSSGVTVCQGMPAVTSNVNTGRHDGKASLSFDGTTLYFGAAQRPGNLGTGCPYGATCFFDLWVSTREKLKSEDGPKTQE